MLSFADPDGMALEIVAAGEPGMGLPVVGSDVPREHALLGFHGVTLGLNDPAATAQVLTAVFGWRNFGVEGGRTRYAAGNASTVLGRFVDLVAVSGARGRQGRGSVHHIAFRAGSDADQAGMVGTLAGLGLAATEQKDRFYLRSVYFREPGGILFEIATDDPGFAADEALADLGKALKLPPQYEAARARIEAALPKL